MSLYLRMASRLLLVGSLHRQGWFGMGLLIHIFKSLLKQKDRLENKACMTKIPLPPMCQVRASHEQDSRLEDDCQMGREAW